MGLITSIYHHKEKKKEQRYAVHCPGKDKCKQTNEECFNVTLEKSDFQSSDNEYSLIGNHETQMSEGGEADLHRYLAGCKKNPGHRQFIPFHTFTLKHLPEGHQNIDLYELIKASADLTVRVSVNIISGKRPTTWPKTNRPYPFHNMRNTRDLRTGSGRMRNVNKYQDGVKQDGRNGATDYTKCWCRKCEDSESPSNVWWEFYVHTATHVVFDDIEASHTTLRLFYDRDDSPVVSVDKVGIVDTNVMYDMCLLNCVTCDQNLGDKLMINSKHYENVSKKVFDNYKYSRSKHKLNFIVSHPHGCFKQVSIGQWKNKYKVGHRFKLTYTTCTCPGSSGANVKCVGFNDGWWWSDLVHSGTKYGLNYSGACDAW